jgi:chemotaxis protein methyltransferase CheR
MVPGLENTPANKSQNTTSLEWSEQELIKLISAVREQYDIDFSDYARPSLSRRLTHLIKICSLQGLDELIDRIHKDKSFKKILINEITVGATEMFRDPEMWIALKRVILPHLFEVNEKLNFWITGCASGEEVYTLAILLREMKTSDRAEILATDLDPMVLDIAKKGFYYHHSYEKNMDNYTEFEGQRTLDSYMKMDKMGYHMDPSLLGNVRFEQHDLVQDKYKGNFDVIFCRNVMIYFNQDLQSMVLSKFRSVLGAGGYLALGAKESIIWSGNHHQFKLALPKEKIYRLI